MNEIQKEKYRPLFEAILTLETIEECERFFEDLCTIRELIDMSDRLEVAKYLIKGETYESISNKTKMSSATISRVNRCIQHGAGGYQEIISKTKR
jgi:TrpR-related protein YerC/YecD